MNRSLMSRNLTFLVLSNSFLFLAYLSYQLLPLHIKALGGGESDIGRVMGVPNLMSVILTPTFGVLVDRFGRKPIILLGQGFVLAPCLGFLGAGDSFFLFGVFRVLQTIGIAMAFTAAGVLVADTTPPGRLAQALGLYGLSGLATHAIAPSVGEIVIDAGGFSALFALSIVYSVLGFGLASRIIDKSLEHGIARGEGSLWKLFTAPGFSQILLIGFVMGATLGTVSTYIPTYIRSRGIQWISLFYITYALTAIFVRIALGRMSDRIGHERMVTPAFGGLAIAVVLLSQAQAQWMFALSGMFNGASHGFLYPATNAMALNRAGRENAGRAQSLYGASFSAGMTAGVFLNGYLADFFGYSVMFLGMGGWILIALSAFYGLERRRPPVPS